MPALAVRAVVVGPAVLLLIASGASAAVQVQTLNIPTTTYAAVNGTPGNFNSNTTTVPASLLSVSLGNVHQFNAALGTLTEVDVTFTDTYRIVTVAGGTDNGNGGTFSGPTSFGADEAYAAVGNTNGSSSTPNTTTTADVPLALTVTAFNALAASELFPALLGTGTTTFAFAEQNSITIYASDTGSAALSNRGGTLSVTYTYTPVPEPTSLAAIALTAGLLRRRRR